MHFKYTTCLSVCLFMLAIVLYVYFEKTGIVRKVRESKVSGGTGFMK